MNDRELVTTVCPIIRDIGWSFYFTPATARHGESLGLDQFEFYFLGRGGVLGDVEPAVVSSAFGYFNPSLVARMWLAAREKAAPRKAGHAFNESCCDHGRAKLGGVPGLAEFVAAGEKVLAACDGDGFALFAGTAAEPAAADLPARAMQLVTILREYRGGAHLAAVRAVGLDSRTAHFVKRPGDIAMFGWSDEDAPVVDDEVRSRMDEAEDITDRIVTPAYAVLDEAERAAFVAGLRAIEAALTA